MLRILYIGIGEMGSGMASNILAKNGGLTLWNRTLHKPGVERLIGLGAHFANDIEDAAGEADFICFNLASGEAVTAVAARIAARVRPGSIIMDFSTISPDSAVKLASAFNERGSFFLDCPVSGGAEGAVNGTLTIMAGGDREAFDKAVPILEMCGANIHYMGGSGYGQKTKLINQLLAWVNQSAVCEAMLLAEKSGLDLLSLYPVLETAWGRSFMLERSVRQHIIPQAYNSSASIDLICKDFGIVAEAANQAGCEIPITAIAKKWYDEALEAGYGKNDPAVIFEGMKARQVKRGRLLSAIIPAFNEEKNIPFVVEAVSEVLAAADIDYEIILIDDGSRDKTFEAVEKAAARDHRVRGLKFSRNFGKEAAILAGLEAAKGDCCVVLDADLQHPPDRLPEMVNLWQEGAMIVQGVKADRGRESLLYRIFTKLFYGVLSRFTQIDFHRASDFKLLDRKIADLLIAMPEKTRFFRALSVYYGFPQAEVEFSVAPRKAGVSAWSPKSLFSYAIDNIVSFSAFPLQIITYIGSVILLLFLILGLQTLYNYISGRAVEGFTTVILLLLFIASAVSISLGIIGRYIANIYDEVKARPPYAVEKDTGGHVPLK